MVPQARRRLRRRLTSGLAPSFTCPRAGSGSPALDGIEKKLHLLARRLVLPHPRGGTLDVTAPLPPHMQASFDLLGFDASAYDPIDEAP